MAVYRITQEALNNVTRHAGASSGLGGPERGPDRVRLVVGDDGCGFEVRGFGADHLGIRSMRERAAEVGADFELTSAEGGGTCVTLRWRTPPPAGD